MMPLLADALSGPQNLTAFHLQLLYIVSNNIIYFHFETDMARDSSAGKPHCVTNSIKVPNSRSDGFGLSASGDQLLIR